MIVGFVLVCWKLEVEDKAGCIRSSLPRKRSRSFPTIARNFIHFQFTLLKLSKRSFLDAHVLESIKEENLSQRAQRGFSLGGEWTRPD